MRQKYIDEAFSTWIIFGENTDGTSVDIADINGDILSHINRKEAENIIAWRDRMQEVLYMLIGDDYKKLEKAQEIINK